MGLWRSHRICLKIFILCFVFVHGEAKNNQVKSQILSQQNVHYNHKMPDFSVSVLVRVYTCLGMCLEV